MASNIFSSFYLVFATQNLENKLQNLSFYVVGIRSHETKDFYIVRTSVISNLLQNEQKIMAQIIWSRGRSVELLLDVH